MRKVIEYGQRRWSRELAYWPGLGSVFNFASLYTTIRMLCEFIWDHYHDQRE